MFPIFSEPSPAVVRIKRFVNSLTEAEQTNLLIVLLSGAKPRSKSLDSMVSELHEKDLSPADIAKDLEIELTAAITGLYLVL